MGNKLHSMEETDLNEKIKSIIAKIVFVLELICSVAIMVIVHGSKLIPAKYEIADVRGTDPYFDSSNLFYNAWKK